MGVTKRMPKRGQMWEPCPICGQQPVCVGCGYCDDCCVCPDDLPAGTLTEGTPMADRIGGVARAFGVSIPEYPAGRGARDGESRHAR